MRYIDSIMEHGGEESSADFNQRLVNATGPQKVHLGTPQIWDGRRPTTETPFGCLLACVNPSAQ